MRIARRAGWVAFLTAIFLLALIALLPLRLAIDWFGFGERGLSARAATGSLWFGALQEAQVGPVPLGDLTARLNLLPLILGRARLSLAGAEEGSFEGAVTVTRHSFGFDDVSARLRLGSLSSTLAVSMLDFDEVSGGFAGGRCTRGEGRVRAAVSPELAGLGVGASLSGEARCAGEALLLPLASQAGSERLNIQLYGDGRYRAELIARPADPGLRARLIAAGFRPVGRELAKRVDGAF